MATTYAAYSNVMHGNKAQTQRSQRSSIDSASSVEDKTQQQKKSKWQRFLTELKPIDEPQPVTAGLFTPLPPYYLSKKRASASSDTTEKQSSSRRASQAYEKFKTVVGGEKVNFSYL